MRISRLVSLLLILSILSQPLLVSAADNETDFNSTKTHVNAIQIVNPSLPNVPQQRGRMWEIMSKLFDANGKIGNWYLKALWTTQDGAVLRWTGWNGGRFMTGSIFDTGTNVTIGNQTTIGGTRYDSAGSLITRGTGRELFILQTGDNNADAGIAFRNSGGAYTNAIYRTNIGSNDADLRIAWWDATSTIGSLVDYVTIEWGPSGGNVGIGITDPAFKLDVNGDINFGGDLYKWGVRYTAWGKFYDGTDPLDAVYTDGNVGIGTLVPAQPLDVVGNANISGTLTVWAMSGDSITDGTIDDTELADGSVRTQEIANNTIVNADVNSAAAIAGTKISPNFGSQNVRTTGNIGAGIASPASKLHVRDGANINLRVGSSDILGLGWVQISSLNDAGNTDQPIGISGSNFAFAPSGTAPQVYVEGSTGNVGIGTLALQEKLTVWGSISISADPDTDDDVGDRGYNDARYINVWEAIPGDDIIDGTIDSSEIQNDTLTASDLATGSVGSDEIIDNSVASSELAGTLTYTDNVWNASYRSLTIDHNASGADVLTADRIHSGIRVDIDSSATGWDTANEHRVYGFESDVDVTGDSDLVYGWYFDANTNHSSGTISNIRGSYSYARSNSTAAVTNIQWAFNLWADSQNGSVSTVWGTYGKAWKDAGSTNTTTTMIGQDGEVEIDAGTISSAYATRSIIDRDGGTINNGYLFWGDYQGTQPTNAYGVYIVDPVDNYFAGDVNIATGWKLSLSGNSDATYIMRNGGTNGMEFFTSDTSRMFIADGGNVGIGDTNPSEKLEVEGTIKTSGQLWSAFWNTGTHRGLLLENFDDSANANAVDVAAKLGGTEFRGLRWVQETPWTSGSAASAKDTSLEFGVLQDNVAITPVTIDSNGNLSVTGRVSVTSDPDSGDDVADRDYNDARYYNVWEAINGDVITDGTIDSSEIQNNTLTAADLAADSVWASELADNSVASANIIDGTISAADMWTNSIISASILDGEVTSADINNNTITEDDISDSFVARDSNLLDALDSTAFIRSNADDNVSAHTEWQDSMNARFGNSADFRMWWDDANNRMRMRWYAHGSSLLMQSEDNAGTSRNLFNADPDSGVTLYYTGSPRLTTTSAGVDVTGTVTASDPTAASHLATKNYVDTLVTQGVTWKAPVETGNTVVGTWGACDAAKQSWTTYNKNDDIIYICDGSAWISIGSSASVPYATTTSAGKIQISGDLQGTWNNINLKDDSVDSAAIVNQSIVREDIGTSEIYSNHIFDGTIAGVDIATDTITAGNIAANAVGNSELINTDNYTVRSLTATDGNGIMWEDGVNRITHNDGGGNVQIRFGHDYTSSDERFTHGGSAYYIGWDLDNTTAGAANLDFKVSSNGWAGNDAAVTWGKIFRIGDNELTWDGDTILTDASNVDADTLDTLDSTQFLRSDVADTMSAKLTINNSTYNNHLRFIRSGETWDVTPSTDGSLDFLHTAGAGLNKIDVPWLGATGNVTADGSIGIWDTSPEEKLTVANGTALIKPVPYSGNQDQPYLIAAATNYDGTTTNWGTQWFQHKLKVDSWGTPRVTIDAPSGGESFTLRNGGNVGIWIATPGEKLEVNGNIAHRGGLYTQWATYKSRWMRFNEANNGNEIGLGAGWHTAIGWGEAADQLVNNIASTTEQLSLGSDGNIIMYTNLQSGWGSRVQAMTVDTAGRVGIGENSPQQKLHLNVGTGNADGIRLEWTRPAIRFHDTDGTANQNFQIDINAGELRFQQNNDAFSAAATRMTIEQKWWCRYRYWNSKWIIETWCRRSGRGNTILW